MPKWPLEVVEIKDAGPKGKLAFVKFIGDGEVSEMPVASLEKYEMSFRKLWKRRYEKVYVKAVTIGTQRFLERGHMELSTFCQLAGVQLDDLKTFMSDESIRSWIEMPLERPRHTWNSLRRSMDLSEQSSGDPHTLTTGMKTGASKLDVAKYEIDPELFKEIKRSGLRGDNRIL